MAEGKPTLLATWDSFRGGEFGGRGALIAKNDEFTGQNVLVGRDGGVFARPPCEEVDPTSGFSWVSAKPYGIDYYPGADRAWILYDNLGGANIQASAVSYSAPAAAIGYGGSMPYPTAGVPLDWVNDGSTTYVANHSNGIYPIDHTGPTIGAAIGGSAPGGRAITWYGERLVTGGQVTAPNRLWFSAANAPTTWPAANFLEIGREGDIIAALNVVGDTLIVTMRDGDIYTINGVLGVNDYVRRITGVTHRGMAIDAHAAATTQRGILWFSRNDYDGAPFPISFDGGNLVEVDVHRGWTDAASTNRIGVAAGQYLDDITMVSPSGDAVIYRDGVWTRHTVSTAGFTPGDRAFAARAARSTLAAAEATAVGVKGRYWQWRLVDDNPLTGSTDAAVLDFTSVNYAPQTYFRTNERSDPAGRLIQVRHIDVEFDAYDTGADSPTPGAYPNQFSVEIDAHGYYEVANEGNPLGSPENRVLFGSWSSNPSNFAATGRRVIKRFSAQSHPCRSFQVRISALRGVKVRRISVYGDVQPHRTA